MSEITIHVVDDDAAIRDSLEFLLTSSGFVVRLYDSAISFLERSGQLKGGCVITDIRMPAMSGLELVRELRRRGEALPVIALTGHADFALAVEAVRAGVAGFIEKPFDGDALVATLQTALAGKFPDESAREYSETLKQLSTLEREVLDAILAGDTARTIAVRLAISERAVEVHRANVMARLGVASLIELAQLAIGSEEGGAAAHRKP